MIMSQTALPLPRPLLNWIKQVQALPKGTHQAQYQIEGLHLSLACETRAQQQWIEQKLAPMDLHDGRPQVRGFHVDVVSDCFLAAQLQGILFRENIEHRRMSMGGLRLWRIPVGDQMDLCCRPSQGLIWLVDRAAGVLTVLSSPRTSYAQAEAHAAVRVVITSHLHDQGWHTFHAGAVHHDGATRLIIGNGGKGKTSLIMAFLSAGARFVANERILLKRDGDQIRAQPFPMPVLVGLGTAMQYPEIESYVTHSERLLAPPMRFARKRVKSVERAHWPSLPDKITLLPYELEQIFPQSPCHPGGVVQGVILPQIRPDAPHCVRVAEQAELNKTVAGNYMPERKEKHYPDWLPLGGQPRTAEDATPVIDALCQQAGARVEFFDAKAAQSLLNSTTECLG